MNNVTDSISSLSKIIEESREASRLFSEYSQEQTDKIFKSAATAANNARIKLAKMAVEETDMGIFEDKVIKNHYAAEYIYHAYKNTKTCGVIEEDSAFGIKKIAAPIGVVAAVIPTTNPTSTVIFKTLISLKTRNAIIISPHPRAKKSTIEAAKIILDAAVKAGAPNGIIRWIDEPSPELTKALMQEADLILATGGPGMVKAAYSSGKPAIGVGAGNTPAIIDKSADILMAVNSIVHSKTFDNGMICASEQSVIVLKSIYEKVKQEFLLRGAYFPNEEELKKIRGSVIVNNAPNPEAVGRTAKYIAKMSEVSVPENTKLLIGEVTSTDSSEEFSCEKLSPVLAMYMAENFEDALYIAKRLILRGGMGHTASLFADLSEHALIRAFSEQMKACRILINTPSSQGGIGDLYNFKLAPSLTLGCGSWGGNSVSENVGVKHLLNIKTVAERRENMLWFRTPEKIYIKKGCLFPALEELKERLGKKRAFIVTDNFLYENGYVTPVCEKLDALGIMHQIFFDVNADPNLSSVERGAEEMRRFKPDVIIAFGGGSAMDAAKIMWVLYEHPTVKFSDMAMRFADIRKRIYNFPKMGKLAYFVAVPTSSGTGSEVTPFSVITDEKSGIKYPLADYELLPDMAVIDIMFHMSSPKELTAAAGFDAVTHAVEAYVSMLATDYTDAMSQNALKILFEYLPRAYDNGADEKAREKTANAATMAGMAFANSFLGLCHSMAHKLGSFHHLPHGIANALLISEIIRFNSSETPYKMGTFPQYEYPRARKKYAEIATTLGLSGKDDAEKTEKLIYAIEALKQKIGIKKSIKDYNITENDYFATLDDMAYQAFDDQCTGANPRYPLIEEIKEIYTKAYYGM